MDLAWRAVQLTPSLSMHLDRARIALSAHGGIVMATFQPWALHNMHHMDVIKVDGVSYSVREVCEYTFQEHWLENRFGEWRAVDGGGLYVCRDAAPNTYALRRMERGRWKHHVPMHTHESRQANRARVNKVRISIAELRLAAWKEPKPGLDTKVARLDGNPANDELSNISWAVPGSGGGGVEEEEDADDDEEEPEDDE